MNVKARKYQISMGHSENEGLTLFSVSETETRPAVIAVMTFAEKILQARARSCTPPFLEGGS